MTSTITTLAGQLAQALASYALESSQNEDTAVALRIIANSLHDNEAKTCILDCAYDCDFYSREALDREAEDLRVDQERRRWEYRRRMGEIV